VVDKDGESDGQSIVLPESQRLETAAIWIQFKVFSSNSTTVFSISSLLRAAFCWTANLLYQLR
jgi:hypothetical protein